MTTHCPFCLRPREVKEIGDYHNCQSCGNWWNPAALKKYANATIGDVLRKGLGRPSKKSPNRNR